MTERTSHLAVLWIGSQVKDQGRRQCCHNKHKKFPYRPTREVSLLSGHASYLNIMESQRRDCLDIHLLMDPMVGRFPFRFSIKETCLGQAGKLGVGIRRIP